MTTIDSGNPTPPSSGDRRTPVRRGDIYCSPACGLNCKHEDFERAREGAAALCAALGEGWMPHVWENLGWHFSAKKGKGSATVTYDERHGCFNADLIVMHQGRNPDQYSGSASSPVDAMAAALVKMDAQLAALKLARLSFELVPLAIAQAE